MNLTRAFSGIFLLLCSLTSAVVMAEIESVSASVDKNPVMVDESIVLSVVAQGEADRDAFDPSPLLKDFVVGRTSVSSQTQIINFETNRSTTWETVLIPRKEGRYTIPTFNVGGQTTQPIQLMVVPVSASDATRGRDIYITTEVDKSSVYLQQQLRYTIKLHLAQDLQRGSLQAPVLENADIRQLGKDVEYSEILNGRRYRIIERNFAIIPQQSGTYTINGPLFEGEVLANNRQSFGFFNRTRSINRVGPAIDIDVLPIPAQTDGHWLPSEFVQLSEEWQSGSDEYTVGEPITRTLTLSAIGLVEEQLPEIPIDYPPSIKTYPDQASTATIEKDKVLIAQRVENIALIPGQAGDFLIPSVSVPWFNTATGQTEYATLPSRTITIAPAVNNPAQALPGIPQSQIQPLPQAPAADPLPSQPVSVVTPAWWSYSSWLLLVLWLLTLLLWWRSSKKPTQQTGKHYSSSSSEQEAWGQLTKALKTARPETLQPALSQWLAIICQSPGQALPVSQRQLAHAQLDSEIASFYASQYGRSPQNWSAESLRKVLKEIRKQHQQQKPVDSNGLETLYPSNP